MRPALAGLKTHSNRGGTEANSVRPPAARCAARKKVVWITQKFHRGFLVLRIKFRVSVPQIYSNP
ncbi:MAG: hypothetical protein DRJ61_03090 [Acidobacteria bacterium]|nr:MAG: hypothetical protein DRJ61_03090 [Acidobacteriota bacterium]